MNYIQISAGLSASICGRKLQQHLAAAAGMFSHWTDPQCPHTFVREVWTRREGRRVKRINYKTVFTLGERLRARVVYRCVYRCVYSICSCSERRRQIYPPLDSRSPKIARCLSKKGPPGAELDGNFSWLMKVRCRTKTQQTKERPKISLTKTDENMWDQFNVENKHWQSAVLRSTNQGAFRWRHHSLNYY